MQESVQDILEEGAVIASAPCRLDVGGTLDIGSFYYPLASLAPCTLNMAINLRTTVQLSPHRSGFIKISSRGFESAEYPIDHLPFDHPMGLMFAIAAYFHIDGIHIRIDSASPPRSALGGSSVAAVAMIGAYKRLYARLNQILVPDERIPLLAHAIEESIAGIPCGLQDHLAAVYGGVNLWHWNGKGLKELYKQEPLISEDQYSLLDKSLLLAYCGIPHASKDINGKWVRQFLAGDFRSEWAEIIQCTREFANALRAFDFERAVHWINRETDIRRRLTPEVLDGTGRELVISARDMRCGARFCGAGGGGCLWAVGDSHRISELEEKWKYLLRSEKDAKILEFSVDGAGLSGFAPNAHVI